MLFRGVSSVNLDAKGRMALPVRFRELLSDACSGHIVITIDMEEPCLLLYPLPFWEEIQAQLEALPNVNPAARRIQRLLIGHATDAELDGSGRVLVPPMLRDYASLSKKLVLLGQGRKLEIWSEEIWTQRRDSWLEDGVSMADASAELQSISL
ncbi:MAG: division/cell wall cluster transcriptional repressor MraZ [Gammaproteobacteria bacterium]|jgi:MraZ protein|nr:division/cell wall cluster transcriptional repressor MraZ [Gammaproteobacteria bacterium]